jgi:hypothetical protein
MNFAVPGSFKNEDERIATMEKYQAEGGDDPSVIDQIMSVQAAEPDPEPADIEDGDDGSGALELPAEAAPAEPAPASAPAPAAQAAAPAAPAAASQVRNWTIREEDIPKDEYFDAKEQKMRKFVTHKNPQDLFKSYINVQKRHHYLEDILMPQEIRRAADEARRVSDAEIARLRAENEQLKRGAAPAAPAAAPAAAGKPAVPASVPSLSESSKKLSEAMTALKGIPVENSVEHTDTMYNALTAALENISALTGQIENMHQQGQELNGKMTGFETKQKQVDLQREAEAQTAKKRNAWQTACRVIDTFATTSPDFKKAYGNIDQPFDKMTEEGVTFHANLAGLMFGKHPNSITNAEQMEAASAYLSNNPAIMQKIAQYGLPINEPKNYKAWLELDQVDAMRGGLYRDPVSKRWVQLEDPVTRQPVRLGDMETAFGKYLDITGKRAQMTNQLLKNERQSITNALSRRDLSLVSMDGNQARSDGSGAEMTQEQAIAITEQIDPQGAMTIYMRSGGQNREHIDKLNAALRRLGQPELEVPELDYLSQRKKA